MIKSMCGIIGMYVREDTRENVLKKLKSVFENQKARGRDSFGLAYLDAGNGGTIQRCRSVKEDDVLNTTIVPDVLRECFIIFHHRTATSTVVDRLLAHPFLNEDGKIALVHNGMVGGYDDVYLKMRKRHSFETEHTIQETIKFSKHSEKIRVEKERMNINDSEILLHKYEDNGVVGVLNADDGAVLIIDAGRKVLIGTTGNEFSTPLWCRFFSDGMVLFSSEVDEKWKGKGRDDGSLCASEMKAYHSLTVDAVGNKLSQDWSKKVENKTVKSWGCGTYGAREWQNMTAGNSCGFDEEGGLVLLNGRCRSRADDYDDYLGDGESKESRFLKEQRDVDRAVIRMEDSQTVLDRLMRKSEAKDKSIKVNGKERRVFDISVLS